MTDHFKRLWGLGYRNLVPIIPPGATLSKTSGIYRALIGGKDNRGKAPGLKRPDGLWTGFPDWQNHLTTEADLELWASWGAGVGIKTGVDGTVMIDVDTRNLGYARLIKTAIEERIGQCPIRIGENPKAGFIIMFPEPTASRRLEFKNPETGKPERVEILNGGQQFVAEGMHPCGTAYRWPVPLVEHDQLIQATPGQLADLMAYLKGLLPGASEAVTERSSGGEALVDQETLRGTPSLVRRAVAAIPNDVDRFPDYKKHFIGMAAAIKAALPDDEDLALELFQEWAERWPVEGENKPEFVETKFHSLKPPYRVGAPMLYQLAEEFGDNVPRAVSFWTAPDAGVLEGFSPQTQKEKKRLKQTLFGDDARSALSAATAPLIKGLLNQGVMTILYGESGTGKTFVALDMAYHIATGRDWGGMKVTQSGVVYVAAEGGRGIKRRALALALKFGAMDVPITFISSPIDLLRPEADTGPLIEAIQEAEALFPQPFKVRLVVIDTFSRALAGGEENRSADMGAIVINFDRIRHATGVHLLVVHHSGKDLAKGARGHSLLRAATDTEIEVADHQIAVTKQRDMEGDFAVGFVLDPVVLGEDANRDIQTSATIRLVGRNAIAMGPATGRERDVLDALQTLWGTCSDTDRSEGIPTWAIVDRLGKMKANLVRTYLSRLVAKRLIIVIGQGRWGLITPNIMD